MLATISSSDPLIVTSLFAAIAALSGAVVFLWKQQSKLLNDAVSWRDERITALEKQEKVMEQRLQDLERQVKELEKEKAHMKAQFLIFSTSHDSSPIPMWIKDPSGKILSCNKAYESIFLRPRGYKMTDYIGADDFAVWPKHIAEKFRKNDKEVLDSGNVWVGEETIVGQDDIELQTRIIKYPRYVAGMELPFGIAGVAPDFIANT